MTSNKQRAKRQAIYARWIDGDNKPCRQCGSLGDRAIHRKIPGKLGGRYSLKNCQVLCIPCHRAIHYQGKFKLKDKVRINGRSPAWLDVNKGTARTIVAVYYNAEHKCTFYYVGFNNRGNDISGYPFRSYMLRAITTVRGRPKQKRQYLRRNTLTASPNQNTGGIMVKAV